METRVLKVLTDKDIQKIQETVSSWRAGEKYKDIEGFCKSSTKEEIEKNNFILTPGRYVGFVDDDDDGVSFQEKIKLGYSNYLNISKESKQLDKEIVNILKKLNEK